jgi:hypothetical protein
MHLVKIIDTADRVLGYIPPFPDRVKGDGTKESCFEMIVARHDTTTQQIADPVLVRLYVDRSGNEHIAYRIFDGVDVVHHLPGFQPRPGGAPTG